MEFLKRISICLFAIALITGCAMNDEARDNNRTANNANIQNVANRNNNDTRMQVADEAQDKIENLSEVRHANVIVTNRNAYVAVVLDDDSKGEVRKDVENKISDQVKSTDDNIRNVFVSSNPDFVDRMGDYGDKIQSGKPIRGLFEEFNEMVQRIFPNAR
ncbi:YhcN/YlaJ family sporulation lipoprotein [Halalkalibacter alkalisediminis]|uniref:YhcN/YlaJ family sporulation lipoprotein n=1 Tax=Halalkalibacter alkalisediminis TaxID=935616 RepID=A0ABV6NN36_9BACI|nr:YhcN/YlaJ family sporulation lipoprotein [Halalkalibacter alkalisediminis]